MKDVLKEWMFRVDWNIWTWVGDKLFLLLWNQFSVERVQVARFMAPAFAVYMIFDMFFKDPAPLWLSIPITFITILFMGFMVLYYEGLHRQTKQKQNIMAIMKRTLFAVIAIRTIMLLLLLFLNIPGFVKGDLTTYFMTFVWWWFLNIDCAFVSEEPPKRWKFKIKLPKFQFNPPLPQGA